MSTPSELVATSAVSVLDGLVGDAGWSCRGSILPFNISAETLLAAQEDICGERPGIQQCGLGVGQKIKGVLNALQCGPYVGQVRQEAMNTELLWWSGCCSTKRETHKTPPPNLLTSTQERRLKDPDLVILSLFFIEVLGAVDNTMGEGCSQKLATANILRFLLLVLIPCICALIVLLVILLSFVEPNPHLTVTDLKLEVSRSKAEKGVLTTKVGVSLAVEEVEVGTLKKTYFKSNGSEPLVTDGEVQVSDIILTNTICNKSTVTSTTHPNQHIPAWTTDASLPGDQNHKNTSACRNITHSQCQMLPYQTTLTPLFSIVKNTEVEKFLKFFMYLHRLSCYQHIMLFGCSLAFPECVGTRLNYDLIGDEVKKICIQHFIKIGGKVQTDITYPAGFIDVISIDRTGENFHPICDTKGHFAIHWITPEEAKYKLCKVRNIFGVNDTIQTDLETGKITDFIKFDTMVIRGANLGKIGVITNRERHPSSFDVVHVKDADSNNFATQLSDIFVVGKGNKPWISLPCGKSICLTIAEERDKRWLAKQSSGERVSGRGLLPCRSFCEAAQEGCESVLGMVNASWPDFLTCSQFRNQTESSN
ncbi:hypothetical protein GH733_005861, partial [Mirounga leonina]